MSKKRTQHWEKGVEWNIWNGAKEEVMGKKGGVGQNKG